MKQFYKKSSMYSVNGVKVSFLKNLQLNAVHALSKMLTGKSRYKRLTNA